MPPKTRKNSVSTNDIGGGKLHLIECTGLDKGNRYVLRIKLWLPKKIHRNFLTRPFHCGFCSAERATQVSRQVSSRTPTGAFYVDVLEQYGRKDNIRSLGVANNTTKMCTKKLSTWPNKLGLQ